MAKHLLPGARVSHCVAYFLGTDSSSGWQELSRAFKLKLIPEERGAPSVAVLLSLPADHLADVVEALMRVADPAIPPLFNFSDEAAMWADCADGDELKAYTLAAYNRMPRVDQSAFLDHVQGRQVA